MSKSSETFRLKGLLESLLKGPELFYISDSGDEYSQEEYESAEKSVGYPADAFDIFDTYNGTVQVIDATDGSSYYDLSTAQIKAIRAALEKPVTLYSVGSYEVLTEAEYKAMGDNSTQGDYSFNFDGFDIILKPKDNELQIGCQRHSLDHWVMNIEDIIEDEGYLPETRATFEKHFQIALPYFRKILAAKPQAKKTTKKKAAKKKAKR